jgi:eukaryotic-like serine/threonine-protein kinase
MKDSPELPRRFGRYTLFDFVGKGGMAEIFLARAETELGGSRLCVVKEILPHLANEAKFADMLVFEAKLAARLSHANIVQVFDLGRTEDRLYIAMEYVEGYDLNALLRECTKRSVAMPLEFALEIIVNVLRGLDYAHRREDDEGAVLGIVHRDVSPSNVLVSLSGEVKVCDFGIAHANALVARPEGLTGEAIQGKAGYMSPEHARGEEIDARADVFAAGILLWELLAGKRLYRAKDGEKLLDVARRAEIPALPSRGFAGEEKLQAIASKALSHARETRFETAAAMQAALEEFAADEKLNGSALRFGTWLRENFLKSNTLAPLTPDSKTTVLANEDPAPKPRRAPLIGAMFPSPGAMRTFKELAKAPPEPMMPEDVPEIVATAAPIKPKPKLSALWILTAIAVVLALAYMLTR